MASTKRNGKRRKRNGDREGLLLLPAPQRLKAGGTHHAPAGTWGVAVEAATDSNAYAVEYLEASLPHGHEGTVRLRLDRDDARLDGRPEGAYRLELRGGAEALVTARDERGLYYGACTFEQVLTSAARRGRLPDLDVLDWPDMRYRMVMLDLARDRDFVMDHVKALIDVLSRFKVNMLMLYLEYRYAFPSHKAIGPPRSLTPEQAAELDAYARRRFVEVIAQVNCLGHCEGIVNTEAHKHRVESFERHGFQLCPSRRDAAAFVESLYRDVSAPFSTGFLHVGGDESWELGECPACRRRAARVGKHGLYLAHVLKMHAVARKLGKRMMLWGDMVLTYRGLASKLPKDIVIFDWHYTGRSPETLAFFRKRGFEVFVCPAVNQYWSNFTKTTHSVRNITGLIAGGHAGGAIGECTCAWELSRGAHFEHGLQHLALSAQCAWSRRRVRPAEFARAFSLHFFGHDGTEHWAVCTLLGDELPKTCETLSVKSGRKMRRALIGSADPFAIRREFPEALDAKAARRISRLLDEAERKLRTVELAATRHRDVLAYFRFTITLHRAAMVIVQGLERARLAYARAARAQDRGDTTRMETEVQSVLDEFAEAKRHYELVAGFCRHANAEAGAPRLDVESVEAKIRRLDAKAAFVTTMLREDLPLVRWELLVEPQYEVYDQAHWHV
jgi:hypothetical protein